MFQSSSYYLDWLEIYLFGCSEPLCVQLYSCVSTHISHISNSTQTTKAVTLSQMNWTRRLRLITSPVTCARIYTCPYHATAASSEWKVHLRTDFLSSPAKCKCSSVHHKACWLVSLNLWFWLTHKMETSTLTSTHENMSVSLSRIDIDIYLYAF